MNKRKLTTISLVLLVFLLIAVVLTQVIIKSKNKIPQETGNIEIHFCPQENCEAILTETLNNANESVYCAFYDFNLKSTIEVFKKRKIKTEIIVDRHNHKKAPFAIKAKNPALMHNKFCIIDNNIILTGSMNPTINGATKNNNNLIIIESKTLANNYNDEFKEMKKGVYGKGKQTKYQEIIFNNNKIENYFCPDDHCEEKTITFLKSAKESIQFMTFSFTSGNIASTLKQKAGEGINIEGIMEARRLNMKYNQHKNLKDFINITPDTNPHIMHHKVFIVDHESVLLGSYNPTKAGDTKNDENILIIHDKEITKKFLEEFEGLKGKNTTSPPNI